MRRNIFTAALLAGVSCAGGAAADPCEGRLPRQVGAEFSGAVRYIVDGDGLCVGTTADQNAWVEVRLADFNAPELHGPGGPQARDALFRIAFNEPVTCTVARGRSGRTTSYDRVIAVCAIDGRSLGDRMREAGVAEGGN